MNAEVIICTEKGYLEATSKLLIYSIRNFGGIIKDIPIFSYKPRKGEPLSKKTLDFFLDHNVEFIDIELNKEFSQYPLANKPLVCAHREKNSSAETLIFLDSDVFFLNSPDDFLSFNDQDLLYKTS